MDTRVRDWSTERHDSSTTWRQLRQAFLRVVSGVVGLWLILVALTHVFPFVTNGATLVGALKFAIAERPSLFDRGAKVRLFTFGNSQFLAGIRPDLLDNALGPNVDVVNLALPGEERYVNLLETALRAGNVPTAIVVQAFPAKPETTTVKDVFLDNKRMVGLLFPFKDYVRDLVVFAFQAHGPQNFVRQYKSNAAQIDQVTADRGYYFIKSQSHYANDALPADYSLPTDQPTTSAHQALDVRSPEFKRLIALADTYDFQIVLVPNAYREGAYAPPEATDPALKAAMAPFRRVHVVGPPYWLLPPRMFADPLHLNPAGARQYTAALATVLREQVRAN